MQSPVNNMSGKTQSGSKGNLGSLKKLMKELRPYKIRLIFITILAILSTVGTIVIPRIIETATNNLFAHFDPTFTPPPAIDFQLIVTMLIIGACLYILSSVFSFLTSYSMATVSQKVVLNLRKQISEKLTRLPLNYYDTVNAGDTLSRITNDVENVGMAISSSAVEIIRGVITIVGIFVMMLTINIWLTLIALAILPLSLLLMRIVVRGSQKHFTSQQEMLGKLNSDIEEIYGGHKVVKGYNYETPSQVEFDAINDKLYDASWKSQFFSGFTHPVMKFITNLGYVLISVIGMVFVTQGWIALPGTVLAFAVYTNQFTQPIAQFGQILGTLQIAGASSDRIYSILEAEDQLPDTTTPKDLPEGGVVTFENVKFGYSQEKILIKDLNINVKDGQLIAIVGPTGSGKTTIVNLLMRFYETSAGSIRINGVDLRDITKEQLRNHIGMVLQETWLFHGTIAENIAYGKDGATREEVIEAAKKASADHFIKTLPDGYDTLLIEDATNISDGQKQLLTIARAIMTNSNIIILDEATSSVDTITEMHIQTAMTNIMKGKTSFVIAHRLSTIQNADVILVLRDGDIIEKGSHTQLLEQKGFYHDLYYSQFAE